MACSLKHSMRVLVRVSTRDVRFKGCIIHGWDLSCMLQNNLGVCKGGHNGMVVVLPTWSQSKVRLHLAKYQVSYRKPLTLMVMVTIVHKSVLCSPIVHNSMISPGKCKTRQFSKMT